MANKQRKRYTPEFKFDVGMEALTSEADDRWTISCTTTSSEEVSKI